MTGISNPDRLNNDSVWTSEDKDKKHSDGTYMVFQKIEHDLRKWHKLDTPAQERWVGRKKTTGLLLGTLSSADEKRLVSEIYSADSSKRKQAIARLTRLIDDQRDPSKRFFDPYDTRYFRISKNCPISSHVQRPIQGK